MSANLIATEGPLKGTALPLGGGSFTIGRDGANSLVIADPSLSREHCLLEICEGQYRLVDLKSRNGTYVNGKPVEEWFLVSGDEVRAGSSVFLFVQLEEPAPATAPSTANTPTATQRITADSVYLGAASIDYIPPARVAQDLRALIRISAALHASTTQPALENAMLQLILEAIFASRAAVVNPREDSYALERDGRRVPFTPDPQIIQHVLGNRCAVRVNDPGRSLIAAPIVSGQAVNAVLCAEATALFDDAHLQFLIAAGVLCGIAYERVRYLEKVTSENREMRQELAIDHGLVGDSAPMREVYRFISKVARTEATVLITGESGTGKELVARAIHRGSLRASGPIVTLNCAALTETLLESELFGHERGAFTGAVMLKKGKFEVADGGTVFLDEVGELAPGIQGKLLRALQEHEFERVGGLKPVRVDFRLIAATNRDLEAAVREGRFRQDLFFRLNVLRLAMPPLRNRRDDIAPLSSFLARRICDKLRRSPVRVSLEALRCLEAYHWPGNVRELENAIERAIVLCSGDEVTPADIPDAVAEAGSRERVFEGRYHAAIAAARREVIQQAIEESNGVYSEAAKLLGIHVVHLHRLARTLNLRSESGTV